QLGMQPQIRDMHSVQAPSLWSKLPQSIDHRTKCKIKEHPMQTRCLADLSNTATFDRDRLIGCDGDSGVRNPEKPSLHPLTRLIPNRKRIALVAHDNRKEQLASWTLKHRTRLIEQELVHLVRTMKESLKESSVLDCVLIWPDIHSWYFFG